MPRNLHESFTKKKILLMDYIIDKVEFGAVSRKLFKKKNRRFTLSWSTLIFLEYQYEGKNRILMLENFYVWFSQLFWYIWWFQIFTRLPSVMSSVVTLIGAIIIGFVFGWQLALILFAIIPLIIGSGYFQMKMQVTVRPNGFRVLTGRSKFVILINSRGFTDIFQRFCW